MTDSVSPEFPVFTPEHWGTQSCWVAHTKPRQEKKFTKAFCSLGGQCYLPLRCHKYVSGGKKRVNWIPLFSSYVFFCGDEAMRLKAFDTRCVASILPVPEEEKHTLSERLACISRALDCGMTLSVQPLQSGQTCNVVSGPFKGQKATVIQAKEGDCRIQVEIHMLNMAVEASVSATDVMPCE